MELAAQSTDVDHLTQEPMSLPDIMEELRRYTDSVKAKRQMECVALRDAMQCASNYLGSVIADDGGDYTELSSGCFEAVEMLVTALKENVS